MRLALATVALAAPAAADVITLEGTPAAGPARYDKVFVELVARSDIPRGSLFQSDAMSHLDPLVAEPARNQFLGTVTPWLRRLR